MFGLHEVNNFLIDQLIIIHVFIIIIVRLRRQYFFHRKM